jgi:CHAD domain-containing protein
MAFRLPVDLPVPEAVRAAATERLDHAIALLRDEAADPVDAVHDARKDVKKTRALLRAVRPAFGTGAHRRHQRALRDAGRLLSATRDADVLLASLDSLRERSAGRLSQTSFDALRVRLAATAPAPTAGATTAREEAAVALERLRDGVADWPLRRAAWGTVLDGTTQSYADGRAAFAAARARPTIDALHDWRKRVKDLWYEQRLLRDAYPEGLGAEANVLDALAEHLGDDHDLALLRAALIDPDGPGQDVPADLEPLAEVIDERRAELQAEAWRLGRRVYAERPKAFRRRLRAYLRAARTEAADAPVIA